MPRLQVATQIVQDGQVGSMEFFTHVLWPFADVVTVQSFVSEEHKEHQKSENCHADVGDGLHNKSGGGGMVRVAHQIIPIFGQSRLYPNAFRYP